MIPAAGASASTSEIEARLTTFIEEELLSGGAAIAPDDELLSGELLDSIATVRLATFVQNAFHLEMQPGVFVIENFRTVAVLAAYIQATRGSVGSPKPVAD